MHSIEVRYHDKKIEKLCTDIRKAKKELPAIVAEKLHALVNLLGIIAWEVSNHYE